MTERAVPKLPMMEQVAPRLLETHSPLLSEPRSGAGAFELKLLGCGCFCGGSFGGGIPCNLDLDVCGHFAVQFDGNNEVSQALDRFGQLNLPSIDREALRFKLGSDINRGD